MGFGTPWKAALLLAVGAAGGAAAIAVASVPDGNGVIHACVRLSGTLPVTTGPNLRLIDAGAGQTCSSSTPAGTPSEASVAWNTTGPPGVPGANGTNGTPGAPGKTVTLLGGNTLTLPGGQVIHVGQTPGLTISSPPTGNRTIATLTITDGTKTIKSDLLGFSFAATNAGAAAKKATVHDMSITKRFDQSSTKLFQACVTGKHFQKAKLVFSKSGHTTTYALSNVMISSAQDGSSKGSGQPIETLSLNYTKIEFKYS